MEFITKEEAIRRMNRYGELSQPFFFVIDYKQERIYVGKPEEISPEELLFVIGKKNNLQREGMKKINRYPRWDIHPVSKKEYADAFRLVQQHIFRGDSYLVNLTCSTLVETDLSLKEILYRAQAPYRIWMKDQFVCFSPEIFIRIKEGHIYSYPMKGTIDASLPDARERILSDKKEEAEHATITDLIRNDLSLVADRVTVSRYRYLDEITTHQGTLLQMSSEIQGILPDDWPHRLGTILFSLLPAGSITGAPKKKTMEIIAEAEKSERGFYTGIAGYFDGKELDSCVMIRFIEDRDGRYYYRSGGGITSRSRMENEYNEMKQKVYVPFS